MTDAESSACRGKRDGVDFARRYHDAQRELRAAAMAGMAVRASGFSDLSKKWTVQHDSEQAAIVAGMLDAGASVEQVADYAHARMVAFAAASAQHCAALDAEDAGLPELPTMNRAERRRLKALGRKSDGKRHDI